MTKADLIRNVSKKLRDDGVKKVVSGGKHVFHISDEDGITKDFVVTKKAREVGYTIEDVSAIIDACLSEVERALTAGDNVSIAGFGSIGLNYRKPRAAKHPSTGEWVEVSGRYVPKFTFGKNLRRCAKLYEMDLNEKAEKEARKVALENAYDYYDTVFEGVVTHVD